MVKLVRLAAAAAILLFMVFAADALAQGVGEGQRGQDQRGSGGSGQGPRGADLPRAPLPDFRWIDAHVHLASAGARGERTGFDDALDEAIRAMDVAGARAAVVMPTPQPSATERPYDQDSFLRYLKKYPGRLFAMGGGGSLGPMILRHPDAETVDADVRARFIREAEAILDAGAIGFGEMTAHHLSHQDQHSYHRARPDHPLFLLLADIAARRGAPIDLHMDAVAVAAPLPASIGSAQNPPLLTPNIPAFERLLAHNRGARIVWAHAGFDQTGQGTADLARRLLAAHPNLFMSLKIEPRPGLATQAMGAGGKLRPEWRRLLADFPDRFVIGSDRFFAAPAARGGRSLSARIAERSAQRTEGVLLLLSQLPPDLARRIGAENAARIYKLPGG